jgi:hypothetical protein
MQLSIPLYVGIGSELFTINFSVVINFLSPYRKAFQNYTTRVIRFIYKQKRKTSNDNLILNGT